MRRAVDGWPAKGGSRIGKRGAVKQKVQHRIGVQEDTDGHRYFSAR